MAKSRRSYKGAPVSNTLASGGLAQGATSISVATAFSGWPTSSAPFFVVVDPGTANEEKICVIYATTTTLTVVDEDVTSGWSASANGRGVDDTTDRAHAGGATIYPVFTALEANQANLLVSTYANQGGIVYQGSSNPTQLAIGTASHVLKVNSGATAPEWGQVGTDGIADGAVTTGKILDGTIVNADINASAAIALSKLATGALPTSITVASANLVDLTIDTADIKDDAVTTAKILNSNVTLAKLASAVANALVPVGTITAYAGITAPTGWLLCDGTTSTSGYTALAALVGATTPDLKGRFLIGDNASLTLLGTGGSTTIGTNNLPAHSHAVGTLATAAASTGVSTTSDSQSAHTHLIGTDLLTSTTSHGHGQNNQIMGGTSATPEGTGSYTVGVDGSHTHNITDPTHSHTITGSTADTGGAQAYYPPYGVVNYIIKHD
jgi:microcystin-dependent protein